MTIRSSRGGHVFDTDLLVNKGDLDRARRAFPHVAHVLDDKALRKTFCRFDRPANAAKKKGRAAGLLAIALGVVALAIAAALKTSTERGWGIIAALCGLLSIAIGLFGVLYAGAKRRWLCNRVMTERLRQFHFQAFVCRWREIAASLVGPEAAQAYRDERKVWLERFMLPYPGELDSELTDVIDDDSAEKCWLHPPPRPPAPSENTAGLGELFDAYRDLRILHQLHYADHKLRSDQKLFSWPPRLQEFVFSYAILICILAIFLIHLWIAGLIVLQKPIPEFGGISVHVVVIWVAIAALSARALQEGLQPEREIERYRHYRAEVRAVRDRFDAAMGVAEKFEIMQEMERLSFDEFRNFLISSNEARFII